MKKLSLLLVTLLVASISMVNADESSTTDAGVPTTSSSTMTEEVRPEPTLYNKEMMEKKRMEMKANKEKFKTQLEAKKEEMKSMTDANREEMKSNNQDFKTERASMQKPMLTEEQKTELKSVVEAFRTQMDEHKKMIEAGTMTKEELMVKVEELKTTTYEKVKAII
jgi:hypothetical protein